MLDSELIEQLKKSRTVVGEYSPVIVDFDGEILSGRHRKEASWERTETIDSRAIAEKLGVTVAIAKEVVRMHFNLQRKPSREETQESLLKIAKELELKGVSKENIASEVAKLVPYSHAWVWELLPLEYKQPKKVEAGKIGAQVVEQKKVIEVPTAVQCSYCPMGTPYPKDWNGQLVCPSCFDKLSRGEITLKPIREKSESKEKTTRVEKRVYESGTWKETMEQPVSRMDEAVRDELQRLDVPYKFQEPVCIKTVVPDIIIMKGDKPLAVFLDGEVHLKREDVDTENRELLTKRGFRILQLKYDAFTEEQKKAIVSSIMDIIK